jgi:hypothetical protein
MTVSRLLAALAAVFALAHIPFLATSLEDIDSVNFALGIRDFDVATHRPHPPGYPVYIALGKAATAIAGIYGGQADAPASAIEAKALAVLSLLGGIAAIGLLYLVFSSLTRSDVEAIAATVITATCPLLWYLAARPMSDLPGLAFALASQACLLSAWRRQQPRPDGDRRLPPPIMAASGRMIVLGALLAGLAIGVRSQTMWLTLPVLALVMLDRVGRGVAGALLGSGVTFVMGGLAWGIPLLVASGGLGAYLAALGTQAGEDFTSGEMLYTAPNARAAAFALLRTFVDPWDSTLLAGVVLVLAVAGKTHLLWRDRRSLLALTAMAGPYFVFHLLFQDTSFVRYALPLVPVVAFLAVKGAALLTEVAVPVAAAAISVGAVVVASPVLVGYGAEPSPTVRVLAAMQAEARGHLPEALAMHQTFVRPLEAEEVGITPQLPAPPRREWLELVKHWKSGHTGAVWFLADPVRTDLALIDPASRRDSIAFSWPLVARPAFGGMRPSAVHWYRMPAPGWFAEEGWSLTPETSGIARVMGRGPHLGPITAMVRRRPGPVRILVGGRNLAAPQDPSVRFTLAIDGAPVHEWEVAPGFFLSEIEVPAGGLVGDGPLAQLTIRSQASRGDAPVPTAIEQFDLQGSSTLMWGYDTGWQEPEFTPALGVWRWTSDRATLRIAGPSTNTRITMTIESPLRYFDTAPLVRALAGDRELAVTTLAHTQDWSFDVPADALAVSNGSVTIETNRTFVPADTDGGGDRRRLGLRVFSIQVGIR